MTASASCQLDTYVPLNVLRSMYCMYLVKFNSSLQVRLVRSELRCCKSKVKPLNLPFFYQIWMTDFSFVTKP